MKMLSEQSYNLIQKYFRDNLSQNEKIEFETALDNISFREEVAYQATVLEGVVEAKRDTISDVLKDAKVELNKLNQLKAETPRSKKTFPKILAILALVAVLFTAFYMTRTLSKNQNTEQLFAQYNTVYYGEIDQRNGNETSAIDVNFDKAMQEYKINEDYSAALSAFNLVSPSSNKIEFYKANCYIELGQFEKAKSTIANINSVTDEKLRYHIEWKSMLLNLKTNNKDQAIQSLSDISTQSNHLYFVDAQKLLSTLTQ